MLSPLTHLGGKLKAAEMPLEFQEPRKYRQPLEFRCAESCLSLTADRS